MACRSYLDGLVGERSTAGNQVIVSGIRDTLSFSLAQGHFETDEFRENHAFSQDAYDAFFQVDVSDTTNIQSELRSWRFNGGDIGFAFDPANADPNKFKDSADNFRVGAKHTLSADSDIVFSGIYQNRQLESNSLQFSHHGSVSRRNVHGRGAVSLIAQ